MSVKDTVSNWVEQIVSDYGYFIAVLIIGIIIGWKLKFFLMDRSYRKQIELRFADKDEYITSLKQIVHERISKIHVEDKDKGYFNKIKNFFKTKKK